MPCFGSQLEERGSRCFCPGRRISTPSRATSLHRPTSCGTSCETPPASKSKYTCMATVTCMQSTCVWMGSFPPLAPSTSTSTPRAGTSRSASPSSTATSPGRCSAPAIGKLQRRKGREGVVRLSPCQTHARRGVVIRRRGLRRTGGIQTFFASQCSGTCI